MAHSLKGVSGNIGANDLFGIAKKLELTLRSAFEDKHSIYGQIEMLNAALYEVIFSIQDLVINEKDHSETINESGTESNEVDTDQVLAHLIKNLQQYSTSATDDFYRLKEVLRENRFQSKLKLLEKYINSYDFESALNLSIEIKSDLE